jgi:hypothetical protein
MTLDHALSAPIDTIKLSELWAAVKIIGEHKRQLRIKGGCDAELRKCNDRIDLLQNEDDKRRWAGEIK